ncbi:MAG: glycosyltransferase family 4 protein [Xanthobacter sp.]
MQELERLQGLLAKHERNATRTSWLLRQLGRKLRHLPRDYSRKIRKSWLKRHYGHRPQETDARPPTPFEIPDLYKAQFHAHLERDPASRMALEEMNGFYLSSTMQDLVAQAASLDPNVGVVTGKEPSVCPPWHDAAYHALCAARARVPEGPYDAVVLMPSGRMGGADLVAAMLARALAKTGRPLILRTDDSSWDRPDWYPDHIACVDLSDLMPQTGDPSRALYVLLQEIGAARIFNVNSALAFNMFEAYGRQLAECFRLYAYYFCSERNHDGAEIGYPVWHFATLLPILTAALTDTRSLAETLAARYGVPPAMAREKLQIIYSPTLTSPDMPPAAAMKHEPGERPLILWGGRLDRQKRVDLLLDIAHAMPDVDFACWGKAVLDAPPDLSHLPSNVTMHPPFTSYDALPLKKASGWLYTAAWDGLPTILLELGARGVAIVASGVGGVPELIDEETGWLVPASGSVEDYVAALRALLANPQAREMRARALQARIGARHTEARYAATIAAL